MGTMVYSLLWVMQDFVHQRRVEDCCAKLHNLTSEIPTSKPHVDVDYGVKVGACLLHYCFLVANTSVICFLQTILHHYDAKIFMI